MTNDNTLTNAQGQTTPTLTTDAGLGGGIVYVVDDDASIRRLVGAILASEGIRVEPCETGEKFLSVCSPEQRGCILLDVEMPGLSGTDVQQILGERGIHLPVVFLTGVADVDTSVTVMKRGAIDLIRKPFDKARLIEVVRGALALDARLAAVRRRQGVAKTRYESLNSREREVLGLVVEGLANKQIARRLDLSEKTIEVHRARAMTKMCADSLPELVRLALDAGVGPEAGGATPN